jgi:hypothetical protein
VELEVDDMGRRPVKVLELDMSFEEAMERFIRVDPAELVGRRSRPKKVEPRVVRSNKKASSAKKSSSTGRKNSKPGRKSMRGKGAKP